MIVTALSKDTLMYGNSATNNFKKLLEVTSNEDLVYLTNYKKPIIRNYAFDGLEERNYPEIRNIFIQHINDTIEQVNINAGCTTYPENVRTHMLLGLHPVSSKSKFKYSKKEFDAYFKKYVYDFTKSSR